MRTSWTPSERAVVFRVKVPLPPANVCEGLTIPSTSSSSELIPVAMWGLTSPAEPPMEIVPTHGPVASRAGGERRLGNVGKRLREHVAQGHLDVGRFDRLGKRLAEGRAVADKRVDGGVGEEVGNGIGLDHRAGRAGRARGDELRRLRLARV